MSLIEPELVQQYTDAGWWGEESLSDLVRSHARRQPDGTAYVADDRRTSWQQYDALADDIAATLVGLGIASGEKVAVCLPDTVEVHAMFIGAARAGVVAVGIGARAGDRELGHLITRTDARTLVTMRDRRGESAAELVARLREAGVPLATHIVLDPDGPVQAYDVQGDVPVLATVVPPSPDEVAARALGPNDLSLLNSTSGTTGLPKCVTQFDNRWLYFSKLAIDGGELNADDIFLGAVPAPFGFGLWTSHYAPSVLGVPTIILPRFDVEEMIATIERERVTVLCCVSTQLRMLLNSPLAEQVDLSSLRIMFTGGEAVPYDRAAEFEERTGATVLQFFGSNETGALSYTTLEDSRDARLRTAGRLIPEMAVRLFDDEDADVTTSGGPGRPAGRGPLTCAGYYDDPRANEELYTSDGWMLMGDIVTVADELLSVVGRTSDIIIRGGKNISAAQVEEVVGTHPSVDLVSVVAVPDPVFGERVCAAVSLKRGTALELPELLAHLAASGVSKELYPEHLLLVDEMPRASGGKIAKGDVRTMATASLAPPA